MGLPHTLEPLPKEAQAAGKGEPMGLPGSSPLCHLNFEVLRPLWLKKVCLYEEVLTLCLAIMLCTQFPFQPPVWSSIM